MDINNHINIITKENQNINIEAKDHHILTIVLHKYQESLKDKDSYNIINTLQFFQTILRLYKAFLSLQTKSRWEKSTNPSGCNI